MPERGNSRNHCGRLLVGLGSDTWDPECTLVPGHEGPCAVRGRGWCSACERIVDDQLHGVCDDCHRFAAGDLEAVEAP